MFSINQKQVEADLLRVIAKETDSRLAVALPRIYRSCVAIFETAFESSDTYISLLNGTLQRDFGLTDPGTALNAINNYLKSNIYYKKRSTSIKNGQVYGGFELGISLVSLSEIISFQSLGGSPVPWMEWLLQHGESIVVDSFTVISSNSQNGRAGGLMIKNDAGYSVPSAFAGTESDNFITRTFDFMGSKITPIVEAELKRVF